ncbi:MAG: aldo/keto reductase [Desulfobacterales bacterium]|jgi:aryl-alcohol dehydrogenase-like predicted oxidoreductase|nr:aldo/keto reductase [Desulfobacterales bacterium]
MKYRFLGGSGLMVSRIALGTMTFGTDNWGCTESEAHDILKTYLDAGGNFIDCADVYAGGRAEEIVGFFLPHVNRDDLVIASKCYFPMGPRPNQSGLSRKHVMASCEASLKRLRTDYLDLYYLHGPDPVTSYEETLRAMDDLVRQGKVRYLGCSNLFGWQAAKAAGVAERMGLEPLRAGQYIYSLIHRELERELIPALVDHGIGLTAYSPLGAGLLTGKYKGMRDPAPGTRHFFRTQVDGPRFWNAQGFRIADLLEQVALESGVPMTRLAIGWPLGRKFVSSVIIGVKSVDQLKANLENADWDMPADVWKGLEARTRPDDEYLGWFNRRNYERFFAAVEFHDERTGLL